MKEIFSVSNKAAKQYNTNLQAGANIAGFEKLAEAMLAQGFCEVLLLLAHDESLSVTVHLTTSQFAAFRSNTPHHTLHRSMLVVALYECCYARIVLTEFDRFFT